jgi:hypothetical protein
VNPNAKSAVFVVLSLSLFLYSLAWADEADLTWDTFLRGPATDGGYGIAVDAAGQVYVAGLTWSSDFPTTAVAFDTSHNGGQDAFVAKFNSKASALDYCTFLGGNFDDLARDITVDDAGNAYVIGKTSSFNFPTTIGAFDEAIGGPVDAFVAKLDHTGSTLDYSTFLGGDGWDEGHAIALDDLGNAYVTGETNSATFPVTPGVFDETHSGDFDAFVAKLDHTGSILGYATYLGGNLTDFGRGIALDDSRQAHVTGETWSSDFPTTPGAFDTDYSNGEVFVVKLDATASTLGYATYLGGGGSDYGFGIALDHSGNAYLTGEAGSGFPTTAGAYNPTYNGGLSDLFVAMLNSSGSALGYSTYLGGDNTDDGYGIVVDDSGYAYVTGETHSANFPTTTQAFDKIHNGGSDAFVVKLNPMGNTLDYATFLGGEYSDIGFDIVLDSSRYVYLAGHTESPKFPVTVDVYDNTYNGDQDVFVVKLNTTGSALDFATFLGGGVYVPVDPTIPSALLPTTYALSQNYPNPFNPETTIRFHTPRAGTVSLCVYNVSGQLVRELSDGYREAGSHEVRWDGQDHSGKKVVSGTYLCRMRAGHVSKTIKMVLLR